MLAFPFPKSRLSPAKRIVRELVEYHGMSFHAFFERTKPLACAPALYRTDFFRAFGVRPYPGAGTSHPADDQPGLSSPFYSQIEYWKKARGRRS